DAIPSRRLDAIQRYPQQHQTRLGARSAELEPKIEFTGDSPKLGVMTTLNRSQTGRSHPCIAETLPEFSQSRDKSDQSAF
ncbi:MAG: hypothetical protein AAFY26_27765, partial [Cyanobacteria bacterium J06638_22]